MNAPLIVTAPATRFPEASRPYETGPRFETTIKLRRPSTNTGRLVSRRLGRDGGYSQATVSQVRDGRFGSSPKPTCRRIPRAWKRPAQPCSGMEP